LWGQYASVNRFDRSDRPLNPPILGEQDRSCSPRIGGWLAQPNRIACGALIAAPATASYTERQMHTPQEREAIARAAAQLIRPGQVEILDGGTTTLQARQLPFSARSIGSNN